MGEAKRKADAELARRTAHATKIVEAFEEVIDACIISYSRQWTPESLRPEWDINTLHDARQKLIQMLVIPPSDY